MSGFWCKKRREQVKEPCSDCDDCPGVNVKEEIVRNGRR